MKYLIFLILIVSCKKNKLDVEESVKGLKAKISLIRLGLENELDLEFQKSIYLVNDISDSLSSYIVDKKKNILVKSKLKKIFKQEYLDELCEDAVFTSEEVRRINKKCIVDNYTLCDVRLNNYTKNKNRYIRSLKKILRNKELNFSACER